MTHYQLREATYAGHDKKNDRARDRSYTSGIWRLQACRVVERLPNGYVVKSPWNDWWEEEECREDMAREARVYQRLLNCFGAHKRFITFISYDEGDYSITMEYMVNGTLRAYIEANNDRIAQDQRHQWILAMAKGMEMLHAASVVHCDFSPRNMLLDGNLELKVTDFGCVSMDGSKSSAGGSVRFYPPRVLTRERIEADDDLFALGSSIYEVLIGKPSYMDLETRRIQTPLQPGDCPTFVV
ncbi:hypothetical protein LTR12_017383 [Friedmanniomyces endolithicus]|nr:hypothetical protein LTR74_009149 [Friedmanniomyces endolithicus]KAK1808261.1 hypothetical protein LTR12_017383 [Friedmanniomyces endolithicus]